MIIKVENNEYKLIENYKDCFEEDVFKEKYTDYFEEFDYIVGDYAYGRLRLKGFYDETNSKVKGFNNIKKLKRYLKENCAYGCKYFVLKRENDLK